MQLEKKKELLADILEVDVEEVLEDKLLQDYETWDSVAVLSVIAIINEEFNRFPMADEIRAYKTVGDLMSALE